MDLTPENKEYIDAMSYNGLLSRWRNAPSGDTWFQGETGHYWSERMNELRSKPGDQEEHVRSSKSIGW